LEVMIVDVKVLGDEQRLILNLHFQNQHTNSFI